MNPASFYAAYLPRFNTIYPEQIETRLQAQLNKNRAALKALLCQPGPYTWDNLMQPLEEMSDELHKMWSPVSHLHSVLSSEPLREAYNKALPLLTDYHTEISQNQALFQAISSIAESPSFVDLDAGQKKIIENDLRDFKLAGVHLSAEKKQRLAELNKQLSQLMTNFSEHLLDATQEWSLHVTDVSRLAGLPDSALHLAQEEAVRRKLEGYVLTLDAPSYSSAIKFLTDRALRKEIYTAYATRASDVGPNASRWDNAPLMEAILKIRHEMAQIVGFANYAEYSLATKTAKKPEKVLDFLYDLLRRSRPVAEKEYQETLALAHSLDGLESLEVWDVSYYSEKLQQSKFNFTQEDLRPYFSAQQAMQGMFALVNKLYGITVKEEQGLDVWHPDVRFFSIYNETGEFCGGLYTDLYARQHKRDGAWMDECLVRRRIKEEIQYPVAYLTCNFMPPAGGMPSLLTHDEVQTLFHEFGHCLHHLLTQVDYASVAGINGVPWDAVEFPSQFMENFCWEKTVLDWIAVHYQTGVNLPENLYRSMLQAKHFQTGLQMIRQLEFSLFDFRLHLEYDPQRGNQIDKCLAEVRKETAVIPVPAFNRFQNSFAHVFAGSYAAGYYSYKWSEVLSADTYAQFEENGILDPATGRSFMKNILATGGVRDPLVSFVAFRGREPTIDALLKQNGMA